MVQNKIPLGVFQTLLSSWCQKFPSCDDDF